MESWCLRWAECQRLLINLIYISYLVHANGAIVTGGHDENERTLGSLSAQAVSLWSIKGEREAGTNLGPQNDTGSLALLHISTAVFLDDAVGYVFKSGHIVHPPQLRPNGRHELCARETYHMDPEIGSCDTPPFAQCWGSTHPTITPHLYLRVRQVPNRVHDCLDSAQSVQERLTMLEGRSNDVPY